MTQAERTPRAFRDNARAAMADPILRRVLPSLGVRFSGHRRAAIDRLPEFDALRDEGVEIKNHTLQQLDLYLERFEQAVTAQGGAVHWCVDAEEARRTILKLCRSVGARTVTKGKSMIAEEIGLNPFLEANGIVPVETDLGEYIIQLAHEPPSHIIGPAIHKTKEQVADLFLDAHRAHGKTRRLEQGEEMVAEAREILRDKYLAADVGITGANFLIAETGSIVLVTNEGNGDLTQSLPPMHIAVASIEKLVPTLEDTMTLIRLLARSATGQEMSVYTTMATGPRRADDPDGPAQFHVVLLDNGRSRLIGTEFQDVLRCIRCGACMNHCPIYAAVGGHAYGAVYMGPIGAVLSPHLLGIAEAKDLPNASTFCGRCEEVCPVRIPLPMLMRHWREEAFTQDASPAAERWAIAAWAWLAKRPQYYRLATRVAVPVLRLSALVQHHLRAHDLTRGWAMARAMPPPQRGTFMDQWRARQGMDQRRSMR
jgi:L-lactate dehydrogenase complex protein LldF